MIMNVWIVVYRDALQIKSEDDNLMEILVDYDWLRKYIKKNMLQYFNVADFLCNYTADNTIGLAQDAHRENAILQMEI